MINNSISTKNIRVPGSMAELRVLVSLLWPKVKLIKESSSMGSRMATVNELGKRVISISGHSKVGSSTERALLNVRVNNGSTKGTGVRVKWQVRESADGLTALITKASGSIVERRDRAFLPIQMGQFSLVSLWVICRMDKVRRYFLMAVCIGANFKMVNSMGRVSTSSREKIKSMRDRGLIMK